MTTHKSNCHAIVQSHGTVIITESAEEVNAVILLQRGNVMMIGEVTFPNSHIPALNELFINQTIGEMIEHC